MRGPRPERSRSSRTPYLLQRAGRPGPRDRTPPALFIWAPNGGNIETMNPRYHRLAGPASEIWEIDAPHIEGITTHPEEYERRVVGFLDRALLDAR